MNFFCTFFDHHYLSRGIALYNSLLEHCPSFRLYVLCMDSICYNALQKMDLLHISLISLESFEKDDEALRIAKTNRTNIEYYFTCTPSLPLFIFNHYKHINLLTYIDSDFFFFSNPEPALKMISEHSIAITAHRFPPSLRELEKQYGIFNVGWLTFKRNEQGMASLQSWREQCLEWCYDRLEEGRFADQMYLDGWPKSYHDTLVISHKGINLAPCNIGNYEISTNKGRVMVDDHQLICYHFFGLKDFRGVLYYLSLRRYGVQPTYTILDNIYEPYFQALDKGEKQAIKVLGEISKSTSIRELTQTKAKQYKYSWVKTIGKKFDRFRAIGKAIVLRRFVLFYNNHIILKSLTCGFRRRNT